MGLRSNKEFRFNSNFSGKVLEEFKQWHQYDLISKFKHHCGYGVNKDFWRAR